MKKLTVVIILLFTLSAYPLTKDEYYKIITQAYKTNIYHDAIISIKKAIQEYPDEPNFYSNLVFFYIKIKQFDNALALAKKAYPQFSSHPYVVSAYRSALLNSGWEEYKKHNYEKAYEYFSTAYQAFSNDADTLNGYGSVLRNLKRYEESIAALEKGFKLAPDHQYIRPNLVWAYMNSAWQYIRTGEAEKAKELLKKAYTLGQNMEESFHTSYIYALVNLKFYDEAAPAHALALKKFGMTVEIYQSGFWLLHNPIENYKKQKKYSLVIQSLKTFYKYSKQKNLVRENGQSFTDFALMRMGTETASVISKICPYWRKFTPSEKKLAHKLYSELKQNLPSELEFLVLRFYGDILYRENLISESHKFLEKAYQKLITSFPTLYRVQTVRIPFPLKGHFIAAGYRSSIAITHMGLNKHCYDFFGSNEIGKTYRIDGKTVRDYYGFGVPVYSPVAGKVIHSEDGHQDDPINPPTRADGNWVAIRSADNKIFNFYHLKKNSIKVRVGDSVALGQQIGELGNSSSTVPHLHFGVYSGDWMATYPVQFTNYTLYKNNGKTFIRSGSPGANDSEDHVAVE